MVLATSKLPIYQPVYIWLGARCYRRGMDSDAIDIALLLWRAQLRKRAACDAALARWDLTLPQWGVLRAVASHPDSSTHDLALATGQSDQAAGAVVARLERRGLLQRRNVSGKAILHRLTPAGKKMLSKSDKTVSDVVGAALSGFTVKEIATLRTQLGQFAETF
jgi:DNA-binding MarR family transcriptional regulator